MKKLLLCSTLAAIIAVPLTASAAPREQGQWYLSPKVGYGWADEDRYTDNGGFLGLGLGYVFRDNWTFEGELGYNRYDDHFSEGHFNQWRQLSVTGAVRYLIDFDRAHPYFGIAMGAGRNELGGASSEWGYQVGPIAGFEWDVSDNGAIRFEVSHKYTDFDNGVLKTGFWDTNTSIGYTHYFGAAQRSGPAPMPVSPPMPVTPPPPIPVEPPVRPLPVSITLNGVNFDFDKCTLRADALSILDEAVRVLNGNEIRVELAGHTDAVGSDQYNQTLSECRAKVVGDYLSGHGVSGAKISAVNGYGESRPIDTNDTAEGRARNRRTDLNVE